jgi:beta-lactamase regulating signal transducer with metallopeptidase domain
MKKFVNNLKQKALAAKTSVTTFVQDVKGDLATNTIGAIIVAVVIIGILVLAVNTFFPGFFTDMFNSMKDKLNANW